MRIPASLYLVGPSFKRRPIFGDAGYPRILSIDCERDAAFESASDIDIPLIFIRLIDPASGVFLLHPLDIKIVLNLQFGIIHVQIWLDYDLIINMNWILHQQA